MWIYQGHLGDLYASDYSIPPDDLYCDTCGDVDWELGNFEDAESLIISMADEIAVDGSGGWCLDYITEFVNETFGTDLAQCDVADLVRQNRTPEEEDDE